MVTHCMKLKIAEGDALHCARMSSACNAYEERGNDAGIDAHPYPARRKARIATARQQPARAPGSAMRLLAQPPVPFAHEVTATRGERPSQPRLPS